MTRRARPFVCWL